MGLLEAKGFGFSECAGGGGCGFVAAGTGGFGGALLGLLLRTGAGRLGGSLLAGALFMLYGGAGSSSKESSKESCVATAVPPLPSRRSSAEPERFFSLAW